MFRGEDEKCKYYNHPITLGSEHLKQPASGGHFLLISNIPDKATILQQSEKLLKKVQ